MTMIECPECEGCGYIADEDEDRDEECFACAGTGEIEDEFGEDEDDEEDDE